MDGLTVTIIWIENGLQEYEELEERKSRRSAKSAYDPYRGIIIGEH